MESNVFLELLLSLALLTSDKIPETYKLDDKLLIEALRDNKIHAQSVDWRSPNVIWSDFDTVLVFSTWDYFEESAKFLDLLQKIEGMGLNVYNPPSIIEWNSCKRYLKDLEQLDLNTIETVYIASNELGNLKSILIEKGWDDCVIKPQVSASGYHTYRFNLTNLESIQNFFKDYSEPLMVQPFAEEILSEGEWSFVFFDQEYLHCILKKTVEGNFLVQKGIKIPVEPPGWMIKEAQRIVKILNLPVLQTRIDLIRRGYELRIMEVEMIEPSLYLQYFPGSEHRVAKKIREKLYFD